MECEITRLMNENTEVIPVKVNCREINKQTNMHFLNSVWFPIALVWRVHEEMRPASTSSNCLTDSRVVPWLSVHQSYCCLHSAGGGSFCWNNETEIKDRRIMNIITGTAQKEVMICPMMVLFINTCFVW